MAYMVYQQYTTAILDAYKGNPDAGQHFEKARSYRRWLQSLDIDSRVKNALVEQARTIEAAFERLNSRPPNHSIRT